MKIARISSRQILDSRGNPTVETDVYLENGVMGRAAVPSGASTGSHEAHELRDGGHDFGGKSVLKAVNNVNEQIGPALAGLMADDQFKIDEKMIELDGTEQKSHLGANAILSVSLATAHAAAKARGVPLYQQIADIHGTAHEMTLPMPMMNILNGGKHAEGSDIQEFMIIPVGAGSMAEAIQMGAEVFHALGAILKKDGHQTLVGDEGGYGAPAGIANQEIFELLVRAVRESGREPGKDIAFAIDAASTEFFSDGTYVFESEGRNLSAAQLIDWYSYLQSYYPLISIEDGLAEDDWLNWQNLTAKLTDTQLVGDDLMVTNQTRLKRAIEMQVGNAILIKPNQIGTLTETLATIKLAQNSGYKVIVSHRSGETEDTTIAHLAVGVNAGQIKTGSLSRTERVAKYNELLRISEANPGLSLRNPHAA